MRFELTLISEADLETAALNHSAIVACSDDDCCDKAACENDAEQSVKNDKPEMFHLLASLKL